MPRQKIINDPIYGFISVPYGQFLHLIDHPYFQRLRRIKQGGFSHLVYPGAMHTRFHHTLGAFYLMRYAFHVLQQKEVDFTEEEMEATLMAILMHDMGHGPFSHSLEWKIINCSHEVITEAYMRHLAPSFGTSMELAIEIFQNKYHKKYLYQLISGQLDMDRMDYLTRDSFYTGVAEGVIGYDRIIEMINIKDGQLLIEDKGLYSIEKFLMARRLMYWQVYYHKTVISAEQMLILFMDRLRARYNEEKDLFIPEELRYFLSQEIGRQAIEADQDRILEKFSMLDDGDIAMVLKSAEKYSKDPMLKFLAHGLINRKLFKVQFYKTEEECLEAYEKTFDQLEHVLKRHDLPSSMVFMNKVEITPYNNRKEEIRVINKEQDVRPLSEVIDLGHFARKEVKYYLAFPRL